MENLEIIAIDWGFKIGTALLIYLVGRFVAGLVTGALRKVMQKREVDETLVTFGCNVAYVALMAFIIVAALGQLGIQTASFVAILGAAGLAIALAFQGSLSNLAAGVLLVTFRPFKIGDFVEAGGTAGVVEKIEIFTTQIRTGDNKTIIVPNSGVVGGNIVNYSTKPTRRIDLVIGVGYNDDLDKVRAVLEDIISAEKRILDDPAPTIAVSELGDSSVNFVVRPWVNSADYWPVNFELHETIKKRFDAEGINIPFPQTDVHLHQVA